MKSIKGIKQNIEDIKRYLIIGTEVGFFNWEIVEDGVKATLDYVHEINGVAYVSYKSIFVSKKEIVYSEKGGIRANNVIMPGDEMLFNKIMEYAKYTQCTYDETKNVRDYLLTLMVNGGVYLKK